MDRGDGESQPQDCQNLSDIQNYLVTFNKEIERGDTPQFQTVSLTPIPSAPDTSEVETESSSVQNVSYDTVYYDSQSLLPADPNEGENIESESISTLQSFQGQNEEGEASEIKLESSMSLESSHEVKQVESVGNVSILDASEHLSAVHAQIAELSGSEEVHVTNEFEDHQGISTDEVRVPDGVITMSTNSGDHTVRMVTVDAAEAMSRMQEGTVEVDISQLTGGSLQQVSGSQGNMGHIHQIIQADGTVHHGDPVAMLASVASGSNDPMSDFQGITISQPDLHGAQLVALQSSDGSQPQLVAVQAPDGSGNETVQVVGTTEASALGNGQVILNTQDNNFQSVTIVPSEVSQGGEVSYYLIVPQTEADASGNSQSGEFSMYDWARDTGREVVEEIIDENGTTRKIIRLKMPGSPNERNAQLMCHYCNYTSPKRYLLTRHLKTHSQERPHKCGICSRGFKTLASLQNHVNTHTGTRPHKCRECESSFTTSGELVRHVRYRHSFEKPHKCTECDYASVELSKLKRHMRSHTGERPYRCPNCSYASPDAYKLKRHLRIHTGEKPYECDICYARFTQSNSLKAHRLIHSGSKPVFQCDLCPTTCGRKTDLKIHMQKLHTAEEPLICKKCMQTFPDRYQFKVHLRTHEGEKCFKCQECEYAALSQRHLDSHKLTHSGEKPYKCESCGQAFRQKQLLRRHQNLYHLDLECGSQDGDEQDEDKALYCSECNHTFTSPATLMKHMALHKDTLGKSSQVEKAISSSDGVLQKNIRAELQEGRLTNQAGKAPHVVIVHLDGTIEEVLPEQANIVEDSTCDEEQQNTAEELVNKALEKLQSGISQAVASATSEDIDQAAEMSSDGTVKVICVGGENNTETTLQVPAEIIKAKLDSGTREGSLLDHVQNTTDTHNQFAADEDEHQDAGTQVAFESESDEDREEITIPGITKLPPDSDTGNENATFSDHNTVLHLAKVAESLSKSTDFEHQSVFQDGANTQNTLASTVNQTDMSSKVTAGNKTFPTLENSTLFVNSDVLNQISQSINETITSEVVKSPVPDKSQNSIPNSPRKSTDESGEGECIVSSPTMDTKTSPSSSGEPEITSRTSKEKKDGNISDNQLEEESQLQRKRGRPAGKRMPKVLQQPKSNSVTPPSEPHQNRNSPTPPSTPTSATPLSTPTSGRRMSTRSSPQVNQHLVTTPNKQPQQGDKSIRSSGRKRKPEVQTEVPTTVKRSRRLELAAKQTGGAGKN